MSDLLPESSTPIDASELRHALVRSFNLDELKTVCQDVGINHESIGESRVEAFARELITACQRRDLLLKLVESCRRHRPHTNWYAFIGQEPPDDPSPFKGLSFFDEADAPLFFGRDDLTAELVAHLRDHRFLAVVGASGSGKSSVVRAGVVPALRRETGWPIHIINPTDDPLKALAEPLTRDVESVTAFATLIDDLTDSPRALELFVSRRMAQQKWPGILLVIDQFEELFTLCKDEAKRRAFVDNLVNAAQAHGGLTVVLTLRADFYHHCLQYEALHTLLEQRQKIAPAMNADQLRTAIVQPGQRAGIRFEDGLVELILRDVGATEAQMPEPGALPLLSHALLETWRRREGNRLTLAGYHAAGGVHGAIAQTAETVYQQLAPAQQKVARAIFLRLTELGEGTQDTRRRARLDELIPQNETAQEVVAVIQTLADARLVTTGDEGAEVAHEALIREWPTLQGWLETDREGLRIHRQLTEAAQRWQQNEQDSSYLYRGSRLAQAQEWAANDPDSLNQLEQAFLDAGLTLQEDELAKTKAHARQLQRRALYLSIALVATVVLAAISILLFGQSRDNAQEALGFASVAAAQAETAVYNQQLAQTREAQAVEAEENAVAAGNARATAQVDAISNLMLADIRAAEARIAQQVAETNLNEAERERKIALAQSLAALSNVVLEQRDNDTELAMLLAIEGARLNWANEGSVDWLIDSTLRLQQDELLYFNNILCEHEASILSVAFSSDGHTLASGSGDQTIRLWDTRNPGVEPVVLRGHEASIFSVAFSPDGHTLASGSDDQTIRLWDTRNPRAEPVVLRGHEDWVRSVAFSPDGNTLASGSNDDTVRLWDMRNLGAEPAVLRGHEGTVTSVAFSPDGETLASGSGAIRLWDMRNLEIEPVVLRGHEDFVLSIAFSPDGETLASGRNDGDIWLWDMRNPGSEPVVLRGHETWVNSVAFSPDGETLASGAGDNLFGLDKTVRLWDMNNPETEPVVLRGHEGLVVSVAFSPDGETLVSGSDDGMVRLWSMNNPGGEQVALTGSEANVSSVAFSPDGKTLASGSSDGAVWLWDMSDPEADPVVLRGHESWVNSLTFSPGGEILASGSGDSTIRLWDVSSPETEPVVLRRHEGSVWLVAFSPDGRTLASVSFDGTVRSWDVENPGMESMVLTRFEGLGRVVAFSPDGETMASGSSGAIRLWELGEPGTDLVVLRGRDDASVSSVAFSPDGGMLASGSGYGTVRLWELSDPGVEPVMLRGHETSVDSVVFSPDGETLASGSDDWTIRLWDVSNPGAEQVVLEFETSVSLVVFSPDGNMLAGASRDGTIRLWRTLKGMVEVGCTQFVRRNLSWEEWQRYLPGEPYRQTCPNLPTHFTVPQEDR